LQLFLVNETHFHLSSDGDTSLKPIEATYKMFSRVHDALESREMKPLFKIQRVAGKKETRITNGLFTIKPGW
jgi:hypothetical protein